MSLSEEDYEKLWRCARAVASSMWPHLTKYAVEEIVERVEDDDCSLWHDLARYVNTSLIANFCNDIPFLYEPPHDQTSPGEDA